MEKWREIGKRLGYPECCIETFCREGRCIGDSWDGFCPCENHQGLTLEEVTELIGRSPYNEPVWLMLGDY